jgi:hypothetical protein
MGLLGIYIQGTGVDDPQKNNQNPLEVAHVLVVPESRILEIQGDGRVWAFRSPNNNGGVVAAQDHMLSSIMKAHPVLGEMIQRIINVLQDNKLGGVHGEADAEGGSLRTAYTNGLLTIVVSTTGPGMEAHRDKTQIAQENTPFMVVDDGVSDPGEYDDEDGYLEKYNNGVHIQTDYGVQYVLPWDRVFFDSTITHRVVRPDAKYGRLTVTALLRTAILERASFESIAPRSRTTRSSTRGR